jgi:hypothetical protein
MIRVTYEFFCDVCGEQGAGDQVNIGTGGIIPNPRGQVVMNNVALCQTCAELAVVAMNEALKDRFV